MTDVLGNSISVAACVSPLDTPGLCLPLLEHAQDFSMPEAHLYPYEGCDQAVLRDD